MILSQALIDITGTAEQLNPLYPSKYAGLQFVFTAGTKHFAKIMCAMENASTLICTACVIFLVRFSSASFSGGFKNLQTGKTAPLPKNLFLSLHPCTHKYVRWTILLSLNLERCHYRFNFTSSDSLPLPSLHLSQQGSSLTSRRSCLSCSFPLHMEMVWEWRVIMHCPFVLCSFFCISLLFKIWPLPRFIC